MNLADAKLLCGILPAAGVNGDVNARLLEDLRETFPEVPWRIILNRGGEYTRWSFTVLADDPREHYVQESRTEPSGKCMHCDKTGAELGLPIRDRDD